MKWNSDHDYGASLQRIVNYLGINEILLKGILKPQRSLSLIEIFNKG